jgi:histidinol dehydrogenase
VSRTLTRILKLSQLTPAELGKLKRRSELDIDQALAIAQEVINKIKEKDRKSTRLNSSHDP